MTAATETVLSVLEEAGFERLPKPLVAAGSAFDFDAAARGGEYSHDLVVVATQLSSPRSLARLLRGLARALDQVGSKRPISLVVVGLVLDDETLAEMERYARVLKIDRPDPDMAAVRSALAALLPLALPEASAQGREPLAEVGHLIGPSLSEEHEVFLYAADIGAEAVSEALRDFVDGAFDAVPGHEADL